MTVPSATPEDVAEQQHAVGDEPWEQDGSVPEDAPEADVAEQSVEVSLDDEDAPIG